MAATRISTSRSPDLISLAERMERVRNDANRVAFEHTSALLRTLEDAAALASEVAGGGEAYHVGVRELARRAHIDLTASVLNLRCIVGRAI
jgi:ABC-type transporter Mla subunit MlaD